MQIIDRFPNLPERMPADLEEVRALMRLAFEEGDISGAMKAYENIAAQAEHEGNAVGASELRRFAGSLNGRFRRVRDDLASLGWGA